MTTDASLPMPTSKVIAHPKSQKIDVSRALKLRLQGNTFEEIGKVFDCTGSAVHQALSAFESFINKLQPGQLTAYSEERANLFNVVEQHLTESLLDGDALAKASLNNRAYALKVIHEARRLESGQSTANVSVLGKLIQQAESQLGASKLASTAQSSAASVAQEEPITTEAQQKQQRRCKR